MVTARYNRTAKNSDDCWMLRSEYTGYLGTYTPMTVPDVKCKEDEKHHASTQAHVQHMKQMPNSEVG
jgi:hypothetical protein